MKISSSSRTIVWISVSLFGLVLLLLLTTANFQFTRNSPGGNDFLSRWMGTRLYLTQGQNPYSDETSLAIQKFTYGRPAQPGEDQELFVYPFYTIFLFTPFALIGDYALARAVWMTVLEVALVALAMLSLNLANVRMKPLPLAGFLVFSVLWYHGLRPVINGNAAVLCAVLIVVALWAIRADRDGLAGFCLALATIKPQMVVLVIAFTGLWALSRQRWRLLASMAGWAAFFILLSTLLMPDWVPQFLRQVTAYPGYTEPGTPGAIFERYLPGWGSALGWVVTGLVLAVLAWEWRCSWGKDFSTYYWTACLMLVLTNLVGIRTATENYIAMFPALGLVIGNWSALAGRRGQILATGSLLVMFVGLWWLFLATVAARGGQPMQSSIMYFPYPLFLLAGLYSVRSNRRQALPIAPHPVEGAQVNL